MNLYESIKGNFDKKKPMRESIEQKYEKSNPDYNRMLKDVKHYTGSYDYLFGGKVGSEYNGYPITVNYFYYNRPYVGGGYNLVANVLSPKDTFIGEGIQEAIDNAFEDNSQNKLSNNEIKTKILEVLSSLDESEKIKEAEKNESVKKNLKESYSIEEVKDLLEELIDECMECPENSPGYVYHSAINYLKDIGQDKLAIYLETCYDRCDSSYIKNSSVVDDLEYALSKLESINEAEKNESEDNTLDKVRNIANELMQYFEENDIYAELLDYDYDEPYGTISYEIEWGDWKHDHLYSENLVEEFFGGSGDVAIDSEVTEEDGSDTYSAKYDIAFDLDSYLNLNEADGVK